VAKATYQDYNQTHTTAFRAVPACLHASPWDAGCLPLAAIWDSPRCRCVEKPLALVPSLGVAAVGFEGLPLYCGAVPLPRLSTLVLPYRAFSLEGLTLQLLRRSTFDCLLSLVLQSVLHPHTSFSCREHHTTSPSL